MNSPALGLRVASVIFGLMGLGHLIRMIVCANISKTMATPRLMKKAEPTPEGNRARKIRRRAMIFSG